MEKENIQKEEKLKKGQRRALFINRITSPGIFIVLSLIFSLLLYFYGSLSEALILVCSVSGSLFAGFILKNIIRKTRRPDALIVLKSHAFPSGHTAGVTSFAFAGSYTLISLNVANVGVWIIMAFLVAFLISASRVLIKVHTRVQVCAGFVLGIVVPFILIVVIGSMFEG